MIYKKKLIEVALPLDAINRGARRDKGRKTGTIRSIHKWFAPMPTAAIRSILYSALVDAPADEEDYRRVIETASELALSGAESPPQGLLESARADITESFADGVVPLVLDPFCGGGSTAVEAQRLGLESTVSDLNPIAVLTTATTTQSLVAFGSESVQKTVSSLVGRMLSTPHETFEAAVRHFAERIYEEARSEIGSLYPEAPGGGTVLAWRWCRTVPSPDPAFADVHVPLVRDWWFSKRSDQRAFGVPSLDPATRHVVFASESMGEPVIGPTNRKCFLSGTPITFDYLRERGLNGDLGFRCFGLLVDRHGRRSIAAPVGIDDERLTALPLPPDVRDLPLPRGGLGFRVQRYGLSNWSDVFLPRQVISIAAFARLVDSHREVVHESLRDEAAAKAVVRVLGLCVGRLASFNSTICKWRIDSRSGVGQPEGSFEQAVLPMRWDFVETNPFGGSRGDWLIVVENVIRGFRHVSPIGPTPTVLQMDAKSVDRIVDAPVIVFTDPPYFDQIGYADLSDYFYPWIRIALRREEPELSSTLSTPKAEELIADPSRHASSEQAQSYFRDGFMEVFRELRDVTDPRVPILVVYAQRQQEARTKSPGASSTGWEAMLEALMAAELSVTGTWPIHGTGSTRQRAQKASALATYVLLSCRPRPREAPMATSGEFLAALRSELPAAVRRLQQESIAPVDMAQSAIGPGMAVFSRYSKVIEPDGTGMPMRTALVTINEVLQEVLSEEETEFDGDTRWALTWFEQNGMNPGPFGDADTLSKAKNTSVNGVVQAGIAVERDGQVHLVDRVGLVADWDPTTDSRLTVWEVAQYLIARLDESELEAADLLRRIGSGMGERARILAYLLFQIADRKGWSSEAVVYNGLVQAWPELSRLSARSSGPEQQVLGE